MYALKYPLLTHTPLLKKKIILTQFHMTLTGLKTRKLLLCLPKNNIKKYMISTSVKRLQFFLPNFIFLNFGNVLVIQTVRCLLCVTKLLMNQVVQTMAILRKHPTNLHWERYHSKYLIIKHYGQSCVLKQYKLPKLLFWCP